jgi:mono/diheme cytochrome c family protein
MRKVFKVLGLILLVIILIAGGLLTYVKTALPNVGKAPELTVERTPERIARGRYLANYVTVCVDCHSTRDLGRFSGPLVPGTEGMGGAVFDRRSGFPGSFYAKNITPVGISRYTDGELYRVITTGVNKEGKAMFPVMPYPYYGKMDPEDIKCIIAYIRTLPPVDHAVPASVADFPMNFILNTIPKKADPHTAPPETDTLAHGSYLLNACACIECHTQADKGQIIQSLAYSGGRTFTMPNGSVLRSANITPDARTGIGSWTREQFIAKFRAMGDTAYVAPTVKPGEYNTIMPWTRYGGMTESDLAAIYASLMKRTPVSNMVRKFTPASP